MAIAFRDYSTYATTAATATHTVPRAVGAVAGDYALIILSTQARSTTTVTAPAGWTLLQRVNAAVTYGIGLIVYGKVLGASEPASYNFVLSTAYEGSGGMGCYSGTSTVDTSGSASATSGSTVTAPSLTPAGTQEMLICCYAIGNNASFTAPAGMTLRFTKVQTTATNFRACAMTDLLDPANPTGTKVATASAGAANAGVSLLLTPSAQIAAPASMESLGFVPI